MLTDLTVDFFEDCDLPAASVYDAHGKKIAGLVRQPDGDWAFGIVGEMDYRGKRETRLEALIALFDHFRKERYGIDYNRRPWPVFPPDKECYDAEI